MSELHIERGLTVAAWRISGAKALDPITVYWWDGRPDEGNVTLLCYGCAWTAYFGGMGGRTIKQFFAEADTPYLTGKLGITPILTQRKADHSYLGRIIEAVKAAIKQGQSE